MSDQIDVNQLSNALQTKVDLPAGKNQADIDYVVESQLPTENNNYTWYRLYKSGGVEQGGFVSSASGTVTVNFLKTMADTNYISFKTLYTTSTNSGIQYNHVAFFNRSTSSMQTSTAGTGFSWEVKGMSAQGGVS